MWLSLKPSCGRKARTFKITFKKIHGKSFLEAFTMLCADETPMVRRAAAHKMRDFVSVCAKQELAKPCFGTLLCWNLMQSAMNIDTPAVQQAQYWIHEIWFGLERKMKGGSEFKSRDCAANCFVKFKLSQLHDLLWKLKLIYFDFRVMDSWIHRAVRTCWPIWLVSTNSFPRKIHRRGPEIARKMLKAFQNIQRKKILDGRLMSYSRTGVIQHFLDAPFLCRTRSVWLVSMQLWWSQRCWMLMSQTFQVFDVKQNRWNLQRIRNALS